MPDVNDKTQSWKGIYFIFGTRNSTTAEAENESRHSLIWIVGGGNAAPRTIGVLIFMRTAPHDGRLIET